MRRVEVLTVGRDANASHGIAAVGQSYIPNLVKAFHLYDRHTGCHIIRIGTAVGKEVGNEQILTVLAEDGRPRFAQDPGRAHHLHGSGVYLRDGILKLITHVDVRFVWTIQRGACTRARHHRCLGLPILQRNPV